MIPSKALQDRLAEHDRVLVVGGVNTGKTIITDWCERTHQIIDCSTDFSPNKLRRQRLRDKVIFSGIMAHRVIRGAKVDPTLVIYCTHCTIGSKHHPWLTNEIGNYLAEHHPNHMRFDATTEALQDGG